jgi:hypothetical protein
MLSKTERFLLSNEKSKIISLNHKAVLFTRINKKLDSLISEFGIILVCKKENQSNFERIDISRIKNLSKILFEIIE